MKKLGNLLSLIIISNFSFAQVPKLTPSQCGKEVNLLNYFTLQYISSAEQYWIQITNTPHDSDEYYNQSYFTSSNYPFVSKSYFPGLTHGRAYDVVVSAKINGAWVSGPRCIIYINIGANVKSSRNNNYNSPSVELSIYPNPSNSNGFNVNLTNLKEENNQIAILVYDMFGKQVHTDQFTLDQPDFVTRLNTDGTLSSGIYLVNILVNGKAFNQKVKVE